MAGKEETKGQARGKGFRGWRRLCREDSRGGALQKGALRGGGRTIAFGLKLLRKKYGGVIQDKGVKTEGVVDIEGGV